MDDSSLWQMFVQSLPRRIMRNEDSTSGTTVILSEHQIRQRGPHSHTTGRVQRRRLRILDRCLCILVQQ